MYKNLTSISFYKKSNGRFYSKYIPNISFEFSNRIYNGVKGVSLLIYDEANKTTITSKYVKKIIDYPSVEKLYTYPFYMDDLNNDLGYTNFSKDPMKQFFLKYLLVRYKYGKDELRIKFRYYEKNGKCKLSFFAEEFNSKISNFFSVKEKIILKLQLRKFYTDKFSEILDLKNSPYINF